MAAAVIFRWRGCISLASPGNQVREICIQKINCRVLKMDTLELVRRMEGQGVTSKHAEIFVQILNESLENFSESYVSNEDLKIDQMTQDTNLSKLISELKCSQDQHYSSLLLEMKKLRHDFRTQLEAIETTIETVLGSMKYHYQPCTKEACFALVTVYWR